MKKIVIFVLASAVLGILSGCTSVKKPLTAYDVQYLDYFDTITSITIYAESEDEFNEYKEIAEERLRKYHQLFDIYNNYDGIHNIKSINDSAGIAPVQVDREIVNLLSLSQEDYNLTDGKVNVAMGSVLSIWHDYRELALANPSQGKVPDMVQLRKAAKHTDITAMELDQDLSTVYLKDKQMRLDVGSIAKGYAARRLAEELKQAGVTSGLLNLGGNVAAIGVRGDGKPWRVGVQNPGTKSPEPYLHVVNLEDMCLVTSGTYQRYYEADGVRYHHIINPDTLMPWNEYLSVTILCPDSALADALSTAVFNMELSDGQAFVESLENVEALWILPDESEVQSSGFSALMED